MSAPRVYRAINAISRELSKSGIAKTHQNVQEDYLYRSVDDVLNRLSPLLARHKLCVLPRVLERTTTDRIGLGDQLLVSVGLKVGFDMVSATDGSVHHIETFGEALDASDKATAKAMSSAYKYAMLQAFCVPVSEVVEPDSSSPRLKQRSHDPQPIEGWEQWAAGIIDIASSCVSIEAIDRLQDRQRSLLKSISRERPDLYQKVGQALSAQRAALNAPSIAKQELRVSADQTVSPKPIPNSQADEAQAPPRAKRTRRIKNGVAAP